MSHYQRQWKNELQSIKEELIEAFIRKQDAEIRIESSIGVDISRWKNELSSIKEEIQDLELRKQDAINNVSFKA